MDHITCQALASRRFDVTITGPGGHSWSDYGVGNPVHALSRAVTLFTDGAAKRQTAPRSSFNFGVIEGGSSINSIPSEARAKVDLRSESAERIDQMAALLTSAVERAMEVENATQERGRQGGGAGEGDRVAAGRRAAPGCADGGTACEPWMRILGIRSYLDCSSTDANIPLSLGLPAVSIGAGGQGGGAHTRPSGFSRRAGNGAAAILLALCLLLGDNRETLRTPVSILGIKRDLIIRTACVQALAGEANKL